MEFLVIAPLVTGVGAWLGLLAARVHPYLRRHGQPALLCLILAAIVSAFLPNMGQSLYDVGLSSAQTDFTIALGYLAFGFSITASWVLLLGSRTRWLLLVLVPVSFAQPALWTYALSAWSIGGFAP